MNALRTAKEYRFHGSLKVRNLKADDAKFESFATEVDFRDGLLHFERLHATQGNGVITGRATTMLDPSDSFDAKLQLQQIEVEPIPKILAKFGLGTESKLVRGVADANIKARGKVAQLNQLEKWNIAGNANAKGLSVGDSHHYDVDVSEFQLKDGLVRVPKFDAKRDSDFAVYGKQKDQ